MKPIKQISDDVKRNVFLPEMFTPAANKKGNQERPNLIAQICMCVFERRPK